MTNVDGSQDARHAEEQPQAASRSTQWGVSPNGWLAFGVALAGAGLDQLTKAWFIFTFHLPEGFSVPVLPPVLRLTAVMNRGVTFGLFRADSPAGRWPIVLFALVVVGLLGWWARQVERRITAVALGLVMGGALGNNLIDRIHQGYVTDFIDVSGIGFFPWVFNVADVMIDVGLGLLLLDTLRPQPKAAVAAD